VTEWQTSAMIASIVKLVFPRLRSQDPSMLGNNVHRLLAGLVEVERVSAPNGWWRSTEHVGAYNIQYFFHAVVLIKLKQAGLNAKD